MSTRTIALTLRPDTTQAAALSALATAFNAACNYISGVAWAREEWHAWRLQELVYGEVRCCFGLLAQHTIRAIKVVTDSYKADKTHQHTFRSAAAVVLDTPRLYRVAQNRAHISTLSERISVELNIGGTQRDQLATATKLLEADLVRDHKGRWRLLVSAQYPDPPLTEPTDVLGVDLGIVNIAADSDGRLYSGAELIGIRIRHRRLRKRLQARGTKSAKRKLQARSRKEARFGKDTNHVISKRLVAAAKGTGRGIALEDLTPLWQPQRTRAVPFPIRDRITACGAHRRAILAGWSFEQLKSFVAYKALAAGVRVVYVDPRNSSRTCTACGCVDKRNRCSQSLFLCQSCGFSGLADLVAAQVIRGRGRAVLMQPIVSVAGSQGRSSEGQAHGL